MSIVMMMAAMMATGNYVKNMVRRGGVTDRDRFSWSCTKLEGVSIPSFFGLFCLFEAPSLPSRSLEWNPLFGLYGGRKLDYIIPYYPSIYIINQDHNILVSLVIFRACLPSSFILASLFDPLFPTLPRLPSTPYPSCDFSSLRCIPGLTRSRGEQDDTIGTKGRTATGRRGGKID
jgi:hypothetical protein